MRLGIKRAMAAVCTLLLAWLPLSVAAAPVGGGQASPTNAIKAYGCDMSFWNVGGDYPDYSRVDFEKMKADGCEFVILRMGFEGTVTRKNSLDTAFVTLYEQAKAAGLDVGAYFYALATTYDGAAEDAAWCIDIFEQYGMSFEYPIYYDIEDPGNGEDRPGHDALNAEEMTQLALGWAQTLEAAGYYPGIYSDYETVSKLQPTYTNVYDVWYAYVAYTEGIPEFVPEEQDCSALGGMWQYSWKGSFDGAVGDLDVDVAYKDYPAIMKTNGYNRVKTEWGESLSVMPRHDGLALSDYNGNGEGIAPTYHSDGTVTFKNTVSTAAWSWPSAYMVCRTVVDTERYPLLVIDKSGTAHFNAVLHYYAPDGTLQTADVAALAGEELGEFGSGEMTVTVDVRAALRRLGRLPTDGKLSVLGITYYMMGANGTYVTLASAGFAEAPIPSELTSATYAIDDRFVADVRAPITVGQLLLGLDNAAGVVVRNSNGTAQDADAAAMSGMTVAIEYNGDVVKVYTLSILGDVNGDGAVTTIDARKTMLSTLTPDHALNEWQTLSADMKHSGDVSTSDVRDILLAALTSDV